MSGKSYRAGEAIEDYCRACKMDRIHTVVASDANGHPIRVLCGYCRSEHNYRGGPRTDTDHPRPVAVVPRAPVVVTERGHDSEPDRELKGPAPMPSSDANDLESLLRRVIREEAGITAVTPAAKWRGGSLVLRPGNPALQEKTVPIDTFFQKVVMLRNRLRTLEQQVNASDLPNDAKVKLQGYVSGCYGSLTTFNVLFADEADQFKGSGGD